MKRSSDPNTARWSIAGSCSAPSAPMNFKPKRAGIAMPTWIVESCQGRPSTSLKWHSILGA
jgi:hypothetical protein